MNMSDLEADLLIANARIAQLEKEKAALIEELKQCFSLYDKGVAITDCYFCGHRTQPVDAQLVPCEFAMSSFDGVCGGFVWRGVQKGE